MTTITASTGHTLNVSKIVDHPIFIEGYTKVYEVRNWDTDGHLFMYVAKGCTAYEGKGKSQTHVFYPNGKMWSGFGTSTEKAINGAIKDGWLYAV